MNLIFKGCVLSALSVSLVSCNALPRSGPTQQAIVSNAALVVKHDDKKAGYNYALIDITKSIVPYFEKTFTTSLSQGFSSRGGAPDTQLGIGDVVQVTIFEAQAGGLFVPVDSGSRPGNYVTIPEQTIDHKGMISVPYAGAIKAAGRQVSDVEQEIVQKLANRAIEPQVVITTTSNRSNIVSILGDVNNPAQITLNPAGDKILGIVAKAGGLSTPSGESYVTIERDGKKVTTLFKNIVDNPRENIYVRAGDTIYVNRDRRTYELFGAANTNGRINFEESNLSLSEAVGLGGGLLDSRANPSEVFLYRRVDRKTLVDMGLDVSKFSEQQVPVIFRADMRNPETFFAMQRFKMQDKDIIYVSNAITSDISKFLELVNGVSDATGNVPANAVLTRNSIRDITK